MAGNAVAMIVESRFCMNIAQATIRETTSWRERCCISPRQHTGRQARWQKSEIMLVEAIARRLEPSPGGEMNGSSAPDLSFDAPVGDQPHQRHRRYIAPAARGSAKASRTPVRYSAG